MLTSLAFTVLAATAGRAAFLEYTQSNRGVEYVLSEAGSDYTAVHVYRTYFSQDSRGRQWELANGQLRSGYDRCAFPSISPDWAIGQFPDTTFPPANNQPFMTSVQLVPCKDGEHNKWSFEGARIKWNGTYCLDNTNGGPPSARAVQMWLCSTYENPNQIWNARQPTANTWPTAPVWEL